MTEKTLEIGIIGQATKDVIGASTEQQPVFRRLTEQEIKD